MNWNNNDTKYILKRVIVYFVIASILFFAGQRCAKATVVSSVVSNAGTFHVLSYGDNTINFNSAVFTNLGEGEVIFPIYFGPYSHAIDPVGTVTIGNNNSLYVCDLGAMTWYSDSTQMRAVSTARCNVNTSGGLSKIIVTSRGSDVYFQFGPIITFANNTGEASTIVNGISSTIQDQITAGNNNTQALQNSIYQNSQNEIYAINNVTSATQDNTQAINDLTDTINAPFNTTTGTDYLNTFENLFTTQDENVIRQFVMIPFNLYILLYNAITSGSCQSITLGALYGVNLDLPCINLRQILGVPLYTAIDTIYGACLLFGIVRMIKKFFNSLFSLSSKATDECGIEVFK